MDIMVEQRFDENARVDSSCCLEEASTICSSILLFIYKLLLLFLVANLPNLPPFEMKKIYRFYCALTCVSFPSTSQQHQKACPVTASVAQPTLVGL